MRLLGQKQRPLLLYQSRQCGFNVLIGFSLPSSRGVPEVAQVNAVHTVGSHSWGCPSLGWASQVVQWQRICLPGQELRETWIGSLGWGDSLKEGMATHSSVLARIIPWTEEPGGLQSMGSQRIGLD